ncbi:endoplasmic reticulum-golgi intermediate compartment protein 2 [Mycena floridula]|nr:endoplasmic reticulum-golgi intermediate compartment protein 2 [Mycena floridula]
MSTTPDVLANLVPEAVTSFDAFPKLPNAYKARSGRGGFVTVLLFLLIGVMVFGDFVDFLQGYPDYDYSVDSDRHSYMKINVDIVVAMGCRYLSVDLRDAIGDRMYLNTGVLRRDGTLFDTSQAIKLAEHNKMVSTRQIVNQARKNRGFFWWGDKTPEMKPTYNNVPHGSACRIWGNVSVKKVTANLHITTLGHGYASHEHVPHDKMNLSHVISEFSFGPYFPEITQPLDNAFAVARDRLVAYQYFLHIVPTTYVAPRSTPLRTNQYSVTSYKRVLEHDKGTPGIFFKFDLDPLALTITQRTTPFTTFVLRVLSIIGGVFVCASWGLRVSSKVVEIATGQNEEVLVKEASGVKRKWGGGSLRARTGVKRQGSGWVVESSDGVAWGSNPGSPYAGSTPSSPFVTAGAQSPYIGTPNSPYAGVGAPGYLGSPYVTNSAVFGPPSAPGTPVPGSGFQTATSAGLTPGTPSGFAPPPPRTPRSSNSSFAPSTPGTPSSLGHSKRVSMSFGKPKDKDD